VSCGDTKKESDSSVTRMAQMERDRILLERQQHKPGFSREVLDSLSRHSDWIEGKKFRREILEPLVAGAASIWEPYLVESVKRGSYDTKEQIEARNSALLTKYNQKLEEYYDSWKPKRVTLRFLKQGIGRGPFTNGLRNDFRGSFDPDSQQVKFLPPYFRIPIGYMKYTGDSPYVSGGGPKVAVQCKKPFVMKRNDYHDWRFLTDDEIVIAMPVSKAKDLDIANATHYFEYTFDIGQIKTSVNNHENASFPCITLLAARYIVQNVKLGKSDTIWFCDNSDLLVYKDKATLWPEKGFN